MRDTETPEAWDSFDPDAHGPNLFPPDVSEIDLTESPSIMDLSIFGFSIESLAYLTALAGIVGDHLSTRFGLLFPMIRELNPFTVFLRQNGLWLLFDVLMLGVSIGVPALLMRKWSFKGRWAVLAFPFLLGLARFFAMVYNVFLIVLSF
jgi:hypothetical protein